MPTTVVNRRAIVAAGPPDPHAKPIQHIDISRPGLFGNPFRIGPDGDRDTVLLKYFMWFYAPEQMAFRAEVKRTLTGKILVCWCKPLRCHGDVLAEYCDATTINLCPECGKREEDPDPVAGILHRTRLCPVCYPLVREQMMQIDPDA